MVLLSSCQEILRTHLHGESIPIIDNIVFLKFGLIVMNQSIVSLRLSQFSFQIWLGRLVNLVELMVVAIKASCLECELERAFIGFWEHVLSMSVYLN